MQRVLKEDLWDWQETQSANKALQLLVMAIIKNLTSHLDFWSIHPEAKFKKLIFFSFEKQF